MTSLHSCGCRIASAALLLAPAWLAAQATLTPIVARIVVTPVSPVAIVGQSLQLTAQAVDSAGRPVPNATILDQRSLGICEGSVDRHGLDRRRAHDDGRRRPDDTHARGEHRCA